MEKPLNAENEYNLLIDILSPLRKNAATLLPTGSVIRPDVYVMNVCENTIPLSGDN